MTTKALPTARTHQPLFSLAGLANRAAAVDALWRQRRALARLDESRLADLGLDASSARSEAKRPIWDAPNHWQR